MPRPESTYFAEPIQTLPGRRRCLCCHLLAVEARLCTHHNNLWLGTLPSSTPEAFNAARAASTPADRATWAAGWNAKHADDKVIPVRLVRERSVCLVTGCKGQHDSHGFCKKHLRQWTANGRPNKQLFCEEIK